MPEVNIIVRAKDEATAVLQDIGGGLQTLGGAFIAFGAVAGAALLGAGIGIGKLALDEAKMGPIKKAFDNLAISMGTTADALLKKLRPATLGMLSDEQLVLSAQKLLTSGLADTGDEVAGFAEVATKLGLAVGKDAAGSIEAFANMLLVGGTRGLREFGLSTKEVQARIEELKAANEDLTDQQAFQQAVMEVANETIGRTGDLSDTAAVRMAALGARFENVKDSLAESLQPALETFLTVAVEPLVSKIEEWAPKLTPIIEAFSGLAREILTPGEGDWVGFLNTTVYDALENAFGTDAATKITEFIANFITGAGDFRDYIADELIPKLEDMWKNIDENMIPTVQEWSEELGAWVVSDGVVAFFNALKFIVDTLGTIIRLIDDAIEGIQALNKWTAENLAPPEMRGYPGRAATGTAAAETYLPTTEGGRWGQRVDINVYGLPGLDEAIRQTVERIERQTGPGL